MAKVTLNKSNRQRAYLGGKLQNRGKRQLMYDVYTESSYKLTVRQTVFLHRKRNRKRKHREVGING